jgi:hypothetical protein
VKLDITTEALKRIVCVLIIKRTPDLIPSKKLSDINQKDVRKIILPRLPLLKNGLESLLIR